MPVCEGCGGSVAEDVKFCPTCGRAAPGRPSIDINLRLDDNAPEVACPLCRRVDRVRKLSAMADEDLAQARFISPHTPITRRGVSAGTIALIAAAAVIDFLVALFAVLAATDAPPGSVWVCLGGLALVGVPLLITGLRRLQREKSASLELYRQSIRAAARGREIWEEGYYCSRDDCLYFPGKEETIEAGEIRA